jgi:hypothetical protein
MSGRMRSFRPHTAAARDHFLRKACSDLTGDEFYKLIATLRPAEQEHFWKLVDKLLEPWLIKAIGLAIRQFKKERDRKSDPEIIKRNVKICDLRKESRKVWTLGRLAKDHEMTRQSIQAILKAEKKWRRLAAELSAD